jgi:DUF4097 and DUF4098 domain-containing protein YvlB
LISCGDTNINIDNNGGIFPPFRNTDFEADDSFSKEIEIGIRSRLRLKGINGNITVTGLSGTDSVMITGTKLVGSDSMQDAEEHLQELEVTVQDLANEIFIETIQPQNNEGRKYVVDYIITLPADLEVQITNTNGIMILEDIGNNITVNNTNGDVTLTGITGSAEVNVVNGMIDSDITLPLNGTIDLNTVNGNIDLTIPTDTSAMLSAAVSIGIISDSNLVLQNEVRTSKSLSAKLGNGQGIISLETKSRGI